MAVIVMAGAFAVRAKAAEPVDASLDQSFREMYNLQFAEAVLKAEQAKAEAKDDPMPWVAQACAVLFREFDRLHILSSDLFASDAAFDARPSYKWVPEARIQFDEALSGGEKIAHERLARDKNDVKALFAMTLLDGLRADDAALITKRNLTALGYTKSATGYADRLLVLSPDSYDAHIATGMGKYIIGGKAAPVRWVLRIGGLKGNQEEGLKELAMVAEHGRFLAPFARILLALDDLRHNNRSAAHKKFASLHEQFPGNGLFAEEMQKCTLSSPGVGQ